MHPYFIAGMFPVGGVFSKRMTVLSKKPCLSGFLWTFLLCIAEDHGFTKKDCMVQTDPLNFIHSTSLGIIHLLSF